MADTVSEKKNLEIKSLKIGLPLAIMLFSQVAAGAWVLKGYDGRINNAETKIIEMKGEIDETKQNVSELHKTIIRLETYLETITKWIDKQES